MEFIPTVAMAALILKVLDFLRYAANRDLNGVVTQITAWVAGVVVVCLVAQTTWAAGIPLGGMPLSKLGFWSQVFAGLTVASTASFGKDIIKSVDNQNTAKIPTLLAPGPRAKQARARLAEASG